MKMSKMLKREDFYVINNNTIQKYYQDKYRIDCIVTTHSSFMKTDLFLFKHLNVIISKKTSKKIKEYIKTEYTFKGNKLKQFYTSFYIDLCLRFPKIFSSKGISISNVNENFSSLMIYPCNRKIRFFDFDSGTIDTVVKSGFPNNVLLNEIKYRKLLDFSFILPIIESTNYKYREKIIDGVPLARIKDEMRYNNVIDASWNLLKELHKVSYRNLNSTEYIQKNLNSIYQKLSKHNILDARNINTIMKNFDRIFIEYLKDYSFDVPIVLSHGDFQHGNIWVDKITNNIIFIDWEFADFRSIWYDLYILSYGVRKDKNIELLSNQEPPYKFIKEKIIYSVDEIKIIKLIISLEDINFKLYEYIQTEKTVLNELNIYFEDITILLYNIIKED